MAVFGAGTIGVVVMLCGGSMGRGDAATNILDNLAYTSLNSGSSSGAVMTVGRCSMPVSVI